MYLTTIQTFNPAAFPLDLLLTSYPLRGLDKCLLDRLAECCNRGGVLKEFLLEFLTALFTSTNNLSNLLITSTIEEPIDERLSVISGR